MMPLHNVLFSLKLTTKTPMFYAKEDAKPTHQIFASVLF